MNKVHKVLKAVLSGWIFLVMMVSLPYTVVKGQKISPNDCGVPVQNLLDTVRVTLDGITVANLYDEKIEEQFNQEFDDLKNNIVRGIHTESFTVKCDLRTCTNNSGGSAIGVLDDNGKRVPVSSWGKLTKAAVIAYQGEVTISSKKTITGETKTTIELTSKPEDVTVSELRLRIDVSTDPGSKLLVEEVKLYEDDQPLTGWISLTGWVSYWRAMLANGTCFIRNSGNIGPGPCKGTPTSTNE